jgi:hypothetical protein
VLDRRDDLDATILGRLVRNAHRIELTGESLRRVAAGGLDLLRGVSESLGPIIQ